MSHPVLMPVGVQLAGPCPHSQPPKDSHFLQETQRLFCFLPEPAGTGKAALALCSTVCTKSEAKHFLCVWE